MARHDAGDFSVSYRDFENYPTNLLDRSVVRGYPQSLLESLRNRLKEKPTLKSLFYQDEDATKCNLGILDLNQDACSAGQSNFVRIGADDILRAHLGDTSLEAAREPDFPSKVDADCRFIFLPCATQLEQLQLTATMLRRILSYHQVMPQFLEFLFEFGRKLRIPTVRFNGFYSDMVAREPAMARLLPQGRSGYQYQMCYNMRSAIYEEKWEIWSIRQVAVYHNFDVRTAKQLWILGDPHETLTKVIIERYKDIPENPRIRLGTIADTFRASLDIHLVYIHEVAMNWRTRISDLESSLWDQTLRIRITKGLLGAKQLGELQFAQKNTADVLAVLESNQHNMQALSDFYEHRSNITNNEEMSNKEADSCKESIMNFVASLRELIHETDMEVRQTKLLLQDFADLQTTFVQRRNDVAARNTEHETVAMRIITLITLIYLPPTAVSTFFSAGVLATNDTPDGANGPAPSDVTSASVLTITAMRNLWLESALPLTLGTVVIASVWYYLEKERINKQGEERQNEGNVVVGVAKAYLIDALSKFSWRKQESQNELDPC